MIDDRLIVLGLAILRYGVMAVRAVH